MNFIGGDYLCIAYHSLCFPFSGRLLVQLSRKRPFSPAATSAFWRSISGWALVIQRGGERLGRILLVTNVEDSRMRQTRSDLGWLGGEERDLVFRGGMG